MLFAVYAPPQRAEHKLQTTSIPRETLAASQRLRRVAKGLALLNGCYLPTVLQQSVICNSVEIYLGSANLETSSVGLSHLGAASLLSVRRCAQRREPDDTSELV